MSEIILLSIFIGGPIVVGVIMIGTCVTENNINKYQKRFPSKKDKEMYNCFTKYKRYNNIPKYVDTTCPGKLDMDKISLDKLCKDCSHYQGKYEYLTEDNSYFKEPPIEFKNDNQIH